MKRYIQAEHLKERHTLLLKLIFIMPLIGVINSLILMPLYFTVNSYNWWYVMLMPATFAMIPAMINRKEERKIKYRAVFNLDIDLKKIWVSKIFLALIYMSIAAFVHMIAVYVVQLFIGIQLTEGYSFLTLFYASVILVIVSVWQIPLCLFLAKKLGFIASIAGNAIIGITLGMLFSDKALWIFIPYCYSIRLMVPIMHILPNGIPAQMTEPMIKNTSLVIPCIISIFLFAAISIISANWFKKQEVK